MASLAIGITIGFGLLYYYGGNDNKKEEAREVK
jgi:hypothetical protein